LPDKVLVYGIRDAERAISLINRLAEIPCYPSVIFRIDAHGKLIGALDQLCDHDRPPRMYYMRVLRWNSRNRELPVIAWTLRPQDISTKLATRASLMLGLYGSKLRGRAPMTVEVRVSEHAALHAKMTRVAS